MIVRRFKRHVISKILIMRGNNACNVIRTCSRCVRSEANGNEKFDIIFLLQVNTYAVVKTSHQCRLMVLRINCKRSTFDVNKNHPTTIHAKIKYIEFSMAMENV